MSPGWLALLGGLGLVPFGIKTMSESLQALAGDRLRRRIGQVGERPLAAVSAGVVVSAVSQSASLTTVMAMSFVNAGLMTLWQAASVTIGANVGATIKAWLLALRLHEAALALVGVGALVTLFARSDRAKFSGELALGIGLLFVGLAWLESGLAGLRGGWVAAYLAHLGAADLATLVLTVLIGVAVTVFVQSAGVMIALIMALGSVGLVSFAGAAALVLGSNVGNAIGTQRMAVGTTTDSRRVALFHVATNTLGALLVMLVFREWLRALDALAPGSAELADESGTRAFMAVRIALAHTTFNLAVAGVSVPLLRPLLWAVSRLVGSAHRPRKELRFLQPSMVESPALAIEQGRLEVMHMADVAGEAMHVTRRLFSDVTSDGTELRNRILKLERATDAMQHGITVFMSRVMAGPITRAQSDEIRALIRVADEVESVADYCERLANYRRRLLREGITFGVTPLGELQAYLERTIAFYEEIVDRARRHETGWLRAIETKAQYLAAEADSLRDTNLQRLAAQRATPGEGIFFNDLLVAMRRIRNHALNMAEAFLGQK